MKLVFRTKRFHMERKNVMNVEKGVIHSEEKTYFTYEKPVTGVGTSWKLMCPVCHNTQLNLIPVCGSETYYSLMCECGFSSHDVKDFDVVSSYSIMDKQIDEKVVEE